LDSLQWTNDAWSNPDTGRWMQELREVSQKDREGFVQAIFDEALGRGGWAIYGGERIVGEMLGWYPSVTSAAFLRLLDASIAFVLEQGPDARMHLANYHIHRIADTEAAGSA
jgi:hypothetical protein